MSTVLGKTKDISFTVNILITKEADYFLAHCLELDIVAAGNTSDQSQREIISLICAQIDYAFNYNNLENLYHPAPPEIWHKFFTCKEQLERKYKLESTFAQDQYNPTSMMLPPWLISKTCQTEYYCHA